MLEVCGRVGLDRDPCIGGGKDQRENQCVADCTGCGAVRRPKTGKRSTCDDGTGGECFTCPCDGGGRWLGPLSGWFTAERPKQPKKKKKTDCYDDHLCRSASPSCRPSNGPRCATVCDRRPKPAYCADPCDEYMKVDTGDDCSSEPGARGSRSDGSLAVKTCGGCDHRVDDFGCPCACRQSDSTALTVTSLVAAGMTVAAMYCL